jgi:hypothetical protein
LNLLGGPNRKNQVGIRRPPRHGFGFVQSQPKQAFLHPERSPCRVGNHFPGPGDPFANIPARGQAGDYKGRCPIPAAGTLMRYIPFHASGPFHYM